VIVLHRSFTRTPEPIGNFTLLYLATESVGLDDTAMKRAFTIMPTQNDRRSGRSESQ
jgi:hypothetical protein